MQPYDILELQRLVDMLYERVSKSNKIKLTPDELAFFCETYAVLNAMRTRLAEIKKDVDKKLKEYRVYRHRRSKKS